LHNGSALDFESRSGGSIPPRPTTKTKEMIMKEVALEDLVADCVLTFCENLAELGCPKDKECDMWFRELSLEDQNNVASRLIEIIERNIDDVV
jgi:hypothetical protein